MKRKWQEIKYDNQRYWNEINTILREISHCKDPKMERSAIVRLIRLYYEMAQELTSEDLLDGGGATISAHVCILLAMRYADGAQNTSSPSGYQITKEGEPLLFDLLNISSSLDIDNNQSEQWRQLFEVMRKL